MNENKPTYSNSSQQAHNTDDLQERWEIRQDSRPPLPTSIKERIKPYKQSFVIIPVESAPTALIVDSIDAEEAKKFPLKALQGKQPDNYRIFDRDGRQIGRIILARKLGRPLRKDEYCDYVDHNQFNCRRSNLRVATATQIRQHRRTFKNNISGYKGVVYVKRDKVWKARIWVNGRQIWLGKFDSKYDAHIARCEAAILYHGEFACLE